MNITMHKSPLAALSLALTGILASSFAFASQTASEEAEFPGGAWVTPPGPLTPTRPTTFVPSRRRFLGATQRLVLRASVDLTD
jgi:hypothetical protein